MATFKERLEEALIMRDMKPSELARKTGIGEGAISQYRKGAYKATQSNLEKISHALSVPIPWLIGVTDELSTENEETVVLSSDLADLDAQLNSDGHIELVTYAEFLVSQPEYRLKSGRRAQKIRHYIVPAAAGYASPIEGEDYEILELDDVPAGADYCITVSGDSMEPYIKDGSLVFVKRSLDLTDFDVGVFYVDGDVLIKQLFVDPMHNIYLLSANPRREDANRMIFHNSTSTLMCFGKVLINKLPRPNYL